MIAVVRRLFDKYYDAWIAPLGVSVWWDSIDRSGPAERRALTRPDMLIALVMALAGMAVSIWGFSQTARAEGINSYLSVFLQADVPRVIENMTTTGGDHSRAGVHPIASSLLYPFGGSLTALGLSPAMAGTVLVVLFSGANAALFCLLLRLISLPRLAAVMFTLVFVTSASFLFWSSVVELYPFACFSILLALFLMFRIRETSAGGWIAANILTLGITLPNWMFGLIATAARQKLKSFLVIIAFTLAITASVSVVQNFVFRNAAVFFNPKAFTFEVNFIHPLNQAKAPEEKTWEPLSNLRSLYVTTLVAMPATIEGQNTIEIVTTNQKTAFPKGEIAPLLAAGSWVVLFGLGVWGAVRHRAFRLPMLAAGTLLLAQTLLHTIYGEVTFLYSMHYLPLLMLVAAFSWFTAPRSLVLGLCACVIAFGGLNNVRRLQTTIDGAACLTQLETVHAYQYYENVKMGAGRDLKPEDKPLPESDIEFCKTP